MNEKYDSVLKIVKGSRLVRFKECFDGKLWYECADYGPSEFAEGFFTFPIPFEDTAGAVFKAIDDKPMHFMRWIRKEFERQKEEAKMIAEEKAKWEEELKRRDA